jgi:hypothetical protein
LFGSCARSLGREEDVEEKEEKEEDRGGEER